MNPPGATGVFQWLPYAQVVILAVVAWVVRDRVIRKGDEREREARAVLAERLERAYGPIYFLVGEILQFRLAFRPEPPESGADLRRILATHGHHLRDEHFGFCADLLAGRRPTQLQARWHQQSVYTELERLRVLLFGPASELEAAVDSNPLTVVRRMASRLLNYGAALVFWLALVLLATYAITRGLGSNTRGVVLLILTLTALSAGNEILRARRVRGRLRPAVLRAIRRGETGPQVMMVQYMLFYAGYWCGPHGTDGIFGKDTEESIRRFQLAQGLKVTGRLDKRTRLRLFAVTERGPLGLTPSSASTQWPAS
jgi:hypothetical protein